MNLLHESPLFVLICYRLYIFNYKYRVVAIVRLQSCLHPSLAIHCIPLNFCLTWATTPSSEPQEPLNHWTLASTVPCSCQVYQGPARSWHKTRLPTHQTTQHPGTIIPIVIMATPESLTCTFHEQDPLLAPRRNSDDLPTHVKGIVRWYPDAEPVASYYIPRKYSPSREYEPVEFINNQWYRLFKHKETSTTYLCTHAITNPSSGGETGETRRNQTRSIQEHPQGTKCTVHEKEGEQMFQAIPRRWPSMDWGHKSENPVPYSDTRTKVLQTFQNPEKNVTSSIPGGDTKTLKDP